MGSFRGWGGEGEDEEGTGGWHWGPGHGADKALGLGVSYPADDFTLGDRGQLGWGLRWGDR